MISRNPADKYVCFKMSAEDVSAHLEFLTSIGIRDNEARRVRSMIEGALSEDHVAIFDNAIALLPVDLAIRFLDSERHMMSVRPHMWDDTRSGFLTQRATLYYTGAIIMDLRFAHGERTAADGATAFREHAHFLSKFNERNTA